LTGSLVLKLQTRGGQIKQNKEKDEVNTDKQKAKDEQCGHTYANRAGHDSIIEFLCGELFSI
jgi:hypothetical protein